jgi:lipopolysaccharide export system permease protein
MRVLDKYVIKNFLIGYAIAASVLIGLCIVIDLFVNLDEFAEHADLGTNVVLESIFSYYGSQSTLYFRDFAGIITVIAAVFSLGKMTRNNELVAVMASGVSLKRVIAPIIILAILLSGLLIIDQELIIPRLAHQLIRSHDSLPGEEVYELWFMNDSKGSLICTKKFDEKTKTIINPFIIIRRENEPGQWEVVAKIAAQNATYNSTKKGWDLENGLYTSVIPTSDSATTYKPQPVSFYETDITPLDIPMRLQEGYKSLLSSTQLITMAKQRGTRLKDEAELYLQKHSRITDPVINIVMLMVALPVLVCRDPKAMKTAIMISFAVTSLCYVITFACKMLATEVFLNQIRPEFWAWVPVFIFLPIAFMELDSMKT